MYADYSKYPFLVNLINNVDVIAKEFEDAEQKFKYVSEFKNDKNPTIYNHADYWIKENKFHPDNIGYEARDGVWAAFPVYKIGFPIEWYNVKEQFPNVHLLLKQIPNLYFSCFMRLDSMAKTTAHKHLMKNLIFHLLLHDLDKPCVFNVNGEEKILQKKGDALLFNYSEEHSSINLASYTRINFTIDFDPCFLDV